MNSSYAFVVATLTRLLVPAGLLLRPARTN